ncbi:polymorphic toxin-type HINT domain-containing protein [Streptomyces sp. NPDC059152]|uniref:polymorphic toxin-type HINT domain-containing protein n=1 Tax=Streptomyces sp. NPDC059152 TaxID=3346742 RepID=UPI0036BC291E
MECIEHTYLDRLIAWYVGADEIERCLDTPSMSCLPDLAMSALKMKALKKFPKCPTNSFTPGTRVLMGDRRTKPIEDVRAGDRVVASDPHTGRTGIEEVQDTIVGNGKKRLVRITIIGAGAKPEGAVVATDQHPFWVTDGSGSWVDAAQLKPGMHLRNSTGKPVRIAATSTWLTSHHEVRNLTVAELHTYYVIAGGTSVLVHNAGKFCGADLQAMEEWHKATFESVEKSAIYHLEVHGKGRTFAEYTREAKDLWDKTDPKNRIPWKLKDGSMGWKIRGDWRSGEGIYTRDGKIVTWYD